MKKKNNDHDQDQEINRKRKNNKKIQDQLDEEENDDLLTLSLSFRPSRPRLALSSEQEQQPSALSSSPSLPPSLPQPSRSMQTLSTQNPPIPQLPFQLSPSNPLCISPFAPESSSSSSSSMSLLYCQEVSAGSSRPLRARRNSTQAPRVGKSDQVPAPYPWATTHRATVHSLSYLLSKQIETIKGEVQCKRCERQFEMEYNLREKFVEVGSFIAERKSTMHDRAPSVWMNPVLPTCKFCDQENSAKPLISEKKKGINWLFLLLGQMLGCCTLEQLKYFCKHTKNHRTGAKDRVLYLTYLGLCKQLDPNGPFDR